MEALASEKKTKTGTASLKTLRTGLTTARTISAAAPEKTKEKTEAASPKNNRCDSDDDNCDSSVFLITLIKSSYTELFGGLHIATFFEALLLR